MNELKGAITICSNCKYKALTWHSDLDRLENCRKCSGRLEIIALEKDSELPQRTGGKDGAKN